MESFSLLNFSKFWSWFFPTLRHHYQNLRPLTFKRSSPRRGYYPRATLWKSKEKYLTPSLPLDDVTNRRRKERKKKKRTTKKRGKINFSTCKIQRLYPLEQRWYHEDCKTCWSFSREERGYTFLMKYKKKKSPLSSLYSTRIIETFKIREPRDFIFHENSFLFSSTRGRESNLRNREKERVSPSNTWYWYQSQSGH